MCLESNLVWSATHTPLHLPPWHVPLWSFSGHIATGHYHEQRPGLELCGAFCTLYVSDLLRQQVFNPWMAPLWYPGCRVPQVNGDWICTVTLFLPLSTELQWRKNNTSVIALPSKLLVTESSCRVWRWDRPPSTSKLVFAMQQQHTFFRIPVLLSVTFQSTQIYQPCNPYMAIY